jgi:hypothetical protein
MCGATLLLLRGRCSLQQLPPSLSRPLFVTPQLFLKKQLLRKKPAAPDPGFSSVFVFPKLQYVFVLSRLKIVQTVWSIVLLPPMFYLYTIDKVSLELMQATAAISTFACCMLYIMSGYFSRAIGRISLSDYTKTVRI